MMSEHTEQPPLLHDADLMLALLKAGFAAPATLADCIAHIRANLRAADVQTEVSDDELRERLEEALLHLEKAMLVEPGAAGAYTTTARGHRALRQHPMGIDDSVLMAYPEFADFIHKLHRRPPPADTKASEYEQGYDAFTAGRDHTDNPFSGDSARHLAWENGWFQAFDDHSEAAGE
jgi:ribosome modulation factor